MSMHNVFIQLKLPESFNGERILALSRWESVFIDYCMSPVIECLKIMLVTLRYEHIAFAELLLLKLNWFLFEHR